MARHSITNGPSKWDLSIGLLDGDQDHRRSVRFGLDEDKTKCHFIGVVTINSLVREDGSGENWLFTGHDGSKSVIGSFSTKTRTGWVDYAE